MNGDYILALDQGSTSSRALLFDREGTPVAIGQQALPQLFPQSGWVEHRPEDIWTSQWQAIKNCLDKARVGVDRIRAIGIANQRETTLLWDRHSGKPLFNAIGWQCRRTARLCDDLRQKGFGPVFQNATGLVLDPYFSGTKLSWLLEHIDGARERAWQGDLQFGTVDSWLIYHLTGGQIHVTDFSNASRTLMFNIHTLQWDDELLTILGIPREVLPNVVPSSQVIAYTDPKWFGRPIPIAGIAGDQQAALFGQGCFEPGMIKNTYGTGSFILMNTGSSPVSSKSGLLTTIAWGLDGSVKYALEGAIFVTGAVVQWLRDELQLIQSVDQSEQLALSVQDTGGVYLVPAFTGLGAPHWDPYARGTIVGISRGTGRAHLVRAALESIAYQTRDVIDVMKAESGQQLQELRVDGGAIGNAFLAQFQADILGTTVQRPKAYEATARGAAFLAGLATELWPDRLSLSATLAQGEQFVPYMGQDYRDQLYAQWKEAVARSRHWYQESERSGKAQNDAQPF